MTRLHLLIAAYAITGLVLMAPAPVRAQEPTGASSHGISERPGYFQSGLNLSLNSVVPDAGLTFGLGCDFLFGDYIADRFGLGLNIGWFNVAFNFGDGRMTGEIQAMKAGLLFVTKLSDSARLDFRYCAMPTANYTFDYDSSRKRGEYASGGVAHGPYVGLTYNKFMVGMEYVGGTLLTEPQNLGIRPNYHRSASTFRILVGINY